MLEELFDKYGCDKSSKHQYHTVYEELFESIREKPINILEIGVFRGASTQAWLKYFPNANLYCVDVFTRVDVSEIEVLKNPRVKWIKADSTAKDTGSKVAGEWKGVKFDIIIDDGLHTPRANADTFKNFFPLLKSDGMYIIEDVFPLDRMTPKELAHPWIRLNSSVYNRKEFDYFLDAVKNETLEVFDLRSKTKEPDSYILKIVEMGD